MDIQQSRMKRALPQKVLVIPGILYPVCEVVGEQRNSSFWYNSEELETTF